MYSTFWLLEIESRDFSQAQKERTACKAEQIQQNYIYFHSKQQPRIILSDSVNLLSFASSSFFLSMRKIT